MADNVTLTRAGVIATVTLNRPDRRNSLSDAMLTELAAAFVELRDDAETRVVIVTGAPPVFSAGADAPHARAKTEEERRRLFTSRKSQFRRFFERANTLLENLEQATICMINGHAVGGGWGLTLACDFRIAAEEAQLWIPEVDLGVAARRGLDHALRPHGRAGPREGDHHELPPLLGIRGPGDGAGAPGGARRASSARPSPTTPTCSARSPPARSPR